MMSDDKLQLRVSSILHHVHDAETAKTPSVVEASLSDTKEEAERIAEEQLPKNEVRDIKAVQHKEAFQKFVQMKIALMVGKTDRGDESESQRSNRNLVNSPTLRSNHSGHPYWNVPGFENDSIPGRGITASNAFKMEGINDDASTFSAGQRLNMAGTKLAFSLAVTQGKLRLPVFQDKLEKMADEIAAGNMARFEAEVEKTSPKATEETLSKMAEAVAEENRKQLLTKSADVVSLKPLTENIMFTPDGKLVVRRGQNRRFDFPTDGADAKPVPYETPISFIPEGGVPEKGVHGYSVRLQHGTMPTVPKDYEALSPEDVLKDMYAGMGLPANRSYMPLDRARARAILRLLKNKKSDKGNTASVPQPQVTPAI